MVSWTAAQRRADEAVSCVLAAVETPTGVGVTPHYYTVRSIILGKPAFNGSDDRGRGPVPWGVDKGEA